MKTVGSPFRSFWMGGYEGADHVNGGGQALDMVRATGHDRFLEADYAAVRRLGLRCVRESVGWRLTEVGPAEWDFERAKRMARAARRQGLQVLWTLMHYGVPPDLTLLDDALVPRFARFAAQAARALLPLCPGPRVYTPINEISFLSWAASSTNAMGPAGAHVGDAGAEDSRVSGFEVKRRLVRAALAGMAAIREVDPEARFLHVEPVVHVAPGDDGEETRALAQRIASFQWQAFDMLAGRMEPGLGGGEDALDWIGLNHYHSSQWEVPSEKRLAWHLGDPRRMPLSELLRQVWERYGKPLIVAETGHIGRGRADWLLDVASEARRAIDRGVPLAGVCLYPMLDRPDWHEPQRWHRSGLWHVVRQGGTAVGRRRVGAYERAVKGVVG
ncbi:beta-glucosidase [Roseateles sp.]|uniref:beta-glucosidase n=1 Tax=Roseateles sp. TaxID=1971397 RepID=UPI0031DCD135